MALGKQGWARAQSGDAAGARASFGAQLAIFPGNPEPYVARALIAAGGKDDKSALAEIREAVLHGFSDFPRLDRSELWRRLRRNEQYLGLVDSVPGLLQVERAWPAWTQVRAFQAPKDVATTLADRARLDARIEAMGPALGPRLVGLWQRLNARAAAARLERYVAHRPDAVDVPEAFARLFDLYMGGAALRWDVLPRDDARQLRTIADLASSRLPEGATRSGALVLSALARYAERDWKGILAPTTADTIVQTLDAAAGRGLAPAYAALAAEGGLRVDAERGRLDRAAERYRRFREEHASDGELVEGLRDRLGTLGLRLGGLPAFTTTTLEGGRFSSEELRGRVTVVDFWATWCQPCLAELPTLRRIQGRHGDDVVLLGVNLDGPDDLAAEELRAFTARTNVPGRQLHDGRGWESDLVRRFGVREIPFTVVIGPDGSVLAVGEHGKQLERAVQAALKGSSGS